MSMPLIYTFYRVTQNGQPVDINKANQEDPNFEMERITGCYSDRFILMFPGTDDAITNELPVALLKIIRFMDEEKISAEKVKKINAIGVEQAVGSLDELAEAISSGKVPLENEDREKINRVFPGLFLG